MYVHDMYVCNTFTPHIKASSHATYIMLHSLGVLQFPRHGTTSQWNVVQLSIGTQIVIINSHPQYIVTFK